ncbi:MAG: ABC transporter permease [Rhodothermales bacterium]
MLKTYLTVTLRNLRRQPVATLINVVGLGAAMTLSLLVLLLVQDQRSYDRFNAKADRIVRVLAARPDRRALAATPAYLGPSLKQDVPEVEEVVRFGQIRSDASANDKALFVNGLHVEPSFFSLFDFELVAGDPATALAGPHRIILTEETAARFFGDANPIGQSFELTRFGQYTVTGVVRTAHVKSHLRFDVLASFETLSTLDSGREELQNADNFWHFATYVLLKPGADPAVLAPHLARYAERYRGDYVMYLQRLTAITLGPEVGNEIASYNLPGFLVWALLGLGISVVIVAVFNYVGLAVAQSTRRAREVGIRKAIGATPGHLRAQFLAESIFTALAALVVGLMMVSLLVPAFNQISILSELDVAVSPSMLLSPGLIAIYLVFALGVGLLAGVFPAFRLSSFRPSAVLRGGIDSQGRSASRLRLTLTFAQLAFSFFFIVTTVLLVRQFGYMREGHFGFNVDDQLVIDLQGNDSALLRQELLRVPDVVEAGATSRLPAASGGTSAYMAYGQDTVRTNYFSASAGFIRNLDLVFLAGRNFQEEAGSTPGVLLNETAARRFGFHVFDDALGASVAFRDSLQPVVGVVRDFQVDMMSTAPEPLLILNDPAAFLTLSVRTTPGREEAVSAALKAIWARIDSQHTLEIQRYALEARDNAVNKSFRDITAIVGWLAVLALAIACLGLLSMVAYVVARRVKEVGIRKVLGASVAQVSWLLSREFLLLALGAAALAFPVAYYVNNLWLNTFYDRVAFGAGVMLTGLAIVLTLVLITVLSQAVRAALADPVESLRYE